MRRVISSLFPIRTTEYNLPNSKTREKIREIYWEH